MWELTQTAPTTDLYVVRSRTRGMRRGSSVRINILYPSYQKRQTASSKQLHIHCSRYLDHKSHSLDTRYVVAGHTPTGAEEHEEMYVFYWYTNNFYMHGWLGARSWLQDQPDNEHNSGAQPNQRQRKTRDLWLSFLCVMKRLSVEDLRGLNGVDLVNMRGLLNMDTRVCLRNRVTVKSR